MINTLNDHGLETLIISTPPQKVFFIFSRLHFPQCSNEAGDYHCEGCEMPSKLETEGAAS